MPTCSNCGGDLGKEGCNHHETKRGAGGHQMVIPKPSEDDENGGF